MDLRLDPISTINRFDISGGVLLEKNVSVFPSVTIDGKWNDIKVRSPIIENDVWAFTNAICIGDVEVGCGAIVANGSVVIDDEQVGVVVAVKLAKMINQNGNQEEFAL